MHRTLAGTFTLAFILLAPLPVSSQEVEVRQTIDNLLKLLGTHDANALADYFTNDAVLIVARQIEGKWVNTVETATRWLERMKSNTEAPQFEERISNVEVTIDSGELAYLRADFEIVREGKVVTYGVDVFTLLRIRDEWKIATISYTNLTKK